jgi:hypothetical protein
MKFRMLAVMVVLLACATLSYAEITGVTCNKDSDSAINCTGVYSDDPTDGDVLTMKGDQFWAPGHMLGDISTDTTSDPTLTLITDLNNDSAFDWTSYHVNIVMNQPFTILTPSVLIPPSWTAGTPVQPVFESSWTEADNSLTLNNVWVGQLNFSGSPPIAFATSDELEFKYKISFTGSTSYAYTQEMIPVPEPGTLVLLACGLMGLVGIRRRFV